MLLPLLLSIVSSEVRIGVVWTLHPCSVWEEEELVLRLSVCLKGIRRSFLK